MRWGYTLQVVGLVVFFTGLSMIIPLGFGLYYKDGSVLPLLESIALTCSVGLGLYLALRKYQVKVMTHREGMAVVALGWTAAGIFGGMPYFFADIFPSFVDCVFESMSGFTTTGASVLTEIEGLPKGILMWRSLTHWLGGMGIIVLSLAILPFLGVGGMQLYKAEVPGPTPDKLRPRIKDTAKLLWQVYALFSFLEFILLLGGGMDVFNSLCHTFGTMATGGFSTKNASIAAFDSVYIDTVIIVFMFIAGTNFALHLQLLRGQPLALWRDPEFRFFAALVGLFIAIITLVGYGGVYPTLGESLRYASFQVISILTTTGYATADYELWAPLPQVLLVFCMFVGGCAGSTGGGIKSMRIILMVKQSYRELVRLVHPRAVLPVKLGGRSVSEGVLGGVWGYFV
ncbi:MAG: potassium transporter TrkG, partial [Desulfohalobium sp.]